MKKNVQFFKDCGVGFVLVLVLLFGTVIVRNTQGISGNINLLAFIFPLLFVPLLVSVFHDSSYNHMGKGKKDNQGETPVYKKDTCITLVGLMLLLNLIVSMIVLYYAW